MKKLFAILYLIILLPFFGLAQDNDYLLAIQYYKDHEFEKAAPLYYKLYERTHSTTYFNYYLQCLYQTNDHKTAEKSIKKEIKLHPHNPSFKIYLGQSYQMQQDSAKATAIFGKILKNIPTNTQDYIKTANNFISIRALDFAEKTYRQGQKKFKGQYSFQFELGYLYFIERKWDKMVDAYLNLLSFNESFYQNVQMRFQSALYNDDKTLSSLLKKQLILRIQKSPSKTIYNQLLIWLYLQENNTEKALQQAIALDKRDRKQNFENVLKIGKLALNNDQFDLAVKAFSFIIEKGKNSDNYLLARNYYLQARFRQITSNKEIKADELKSLQADLKSILDEYGLNDETFQIAMTYSKLLAFYRYDTKTATQFLENLENHRLSVENQGQLKLQLANTLIAGNDPWDAVLLLAKVEKNFKNNPLGYQAKFDRARLAYFMGDFKWAQAQLDILKGSTSKLIANDAFYLSELISDNLAKDTNTAPLRIFARAELLEFENRDSLALASLDSITNLYPTHQLADEILFKKAEIYEKHNDFEKAVENLKKVVENYPQEVTADDAAYRLGQIHETELNNPEEAAKYYKLILINYKSSIFVNDSRKHYRAIEKQSSGSDSNTEHFFNGT